MTTEKEKQETIFMRWVKERSVSMLVKELRFRGVSVTRSAVYSWRKGHLPIPGTALAIVAISRSMKKENRLTLLDIYGTEIQSEFS